MALTSSCSDTPLPSPAAGRRRIRLLNALLEQAWAAGAAQRPDLNPAVILTAACRQSRTSREMLCPDWHDRLSLLTDDLERSARLTALGRTIAFGQLVSAAANMLGMLALWKRHPEIEEQAIQKPIIIVGQMRSGTTRVQRLLACDDRFRYTRFYESWNPVPRIAASRYFDDRKWRARAALLSAHFLNPVFRTIHPTGALAADEEIGFLNMLMTPAAYEAQWRIPRFVHHCEAMDSDAVYRAFKRMLQTVGWLRRRRDDRPFILKVPQFGEDLDAVLAAFPDARIVHVTREHDAVLASSASLVFNQMSLQSDRIDPLEVGREWSRKLRLRQMRTATSLADTAAPQIEIAYADIEHDWRAVLRKLYTMLGMDLPPPVERRMAEYLRSCRNTRHAHRYDPASFGLAAEDQGKARTGVSVF